MRGMAEKRVKITMGGRSVITYLTDKDMAALKKAAEETKAAINKTGREADWRVLDELVFGALHLGISELREKYEESQAAGTVRDPRN